MSSSINKFASPSILLFLDQIILAAGGWLYWIMLSKITSVSNIGEATAIYNLVLLGSTLAMLGLEYPLLRRSSSEQSRVLGTALVIELIISVAAVPLILFVASTYNEELKPLAWLAAVMFILSSVGLVPRFALLGVSNSRDVLIMHTIAMVARFFIGYELVVAGYGSLGIILSFLVQFVVGTIGILAIARKSFSLKIGQLSYVKDVLKDALINSPSKLSYLLIFNLSVVLLASFGISSASIGIFYVAVMISSVAGTLGSSMAFMAIPASSITNNDHTTSSSRLSLGLTVPFVAALIVAPKTILGMVGIEYVSGNVELVILSLGVMPYILTLNSISKFNYLRKPGRLVAIGSIQILCFIVGFYLLVPAYGTIGAAISVAIAFLGSGVAALVWSGTQFAKTFASTCVALGAGVAIGYGAQLLISNIFFHHDIIALIVSMVSSIGFVLVLKGISPNEVKQIVRAVISKKDIKHASSR